ncbi:hypothetical protein MTR67_017915 [Solanum verrucosum]|uniref:Integrase catalytic domain-containing protein n=1 Tax=Solanum verrucosum TaxID=315347 RepID=A0AAF0QLF0_SOLVR|nr:hypothetical protein MTR67_017915 [Solanum verrucosum]
MEEAHNSRYSIHPGSTKMYRDLREVYWWNGMKRGIAEFLPKCPNCPQVKVQHQRPSGLALRIELLEWKWEMINMAFITGLPRSRRQHDSIWKGLGSNVNLSTAFHPQTDGQEERTIQTLEDMLRACVFDLKGNWDDHLPLIEFAYNKSYHFSIQMAPYETLYGRRCGSPIGWFEVGKGELIGPDLVHQAMEKVKVIQERLKTTQSHQKSYTNVRRTTLEFEIDDWVELNVSPMKGVMRFVPQKKYRDLREVYSWNGIKKGIAEFLPKCPNCQQGKLEHQRPGGLAQRIELPEWKWEMINMGLITRLPRSRRQHDSIWVIVDRMTKSAHFLPVKTTLSAEDYAKLYIQEIKGLGSKANLSTAFHPQTDGKAERTIQTLEDMLRACVIDLKGNWDDHLPFIEFAYNNSYHSSIEMAPYEALYGRRCRSPIGWFEVGEAGLIGPDLVHQAMEKDVIRFGKKGKLSPQYIGSSRVAKRIGNVAYELELLQELAAVHPVFHISILKKCIGDPSLILPNESNRIKDNLSYKEIPVQILDSQVRRLRTKDVASINVLWRNQFVEEATWEAEEDMKKRYPHLFESGEMQIKVALP